MEGDVITTQELFTYQFEGELPDGKLKGSFVSSGLRPHFTRAPSISGSTARCSRRSDDSQHHERRRPHFLA